MKKAYLTVLNDIDPNEMNAMKNYVSQAVPMFGAKGGEIVLRTKKVDVLKGEPTQILTVLGFPSVEAIKEVFESEAYKILIADRDKAFPNLTIYISEDFDPTA